MLLLIAFKIVGWILSYKPVLQKICMLSIPKQHLNTKPPHKITKKKTSIKILKKIPTNNPMIFGYKFEYTLPIQWTG